MKNTAIMAAILALAGCPTTTPYAWISEIYEEDIAVSVRYNNFLGDATDTAINAAGQQVADRKCGRFDKRATFLSSVVMQRGNKNNGNLTTIDVLYTCG